MVQSTSPAGGLWQPMRPGKSSDARKASRRRAVRRNARTRQRRSASFSAARCTASSGAIPTAGCGTGRRLRIRATGVGFAAQRRAGARWRLRAVESAAPAPAHLIPLPLPCLPRIRRTPRREDSACRPGQRAAPRHRLRRQRIDAASVPLARARRKAQRADLSRDVYVRAGPLRASENVADSPARRARNASRCRARLRGAIGGVRDGTATSATAVLRVPRVSLKEGAAAGRVMLATKGGRYRDWVGGAVAVWAREEGREAGAAVRGDELARQGLERNEISAEFEIHSRDVHARRVRVSPFVDC